MGGSFRSAHAGLDGPAGSHSERTGEKHPGGLRHQVAAFRRNAEQQNLLFGLQFRSVFPPGRYLREHTVISGAGQFQLYIAARGRFTGSEHAVIGLENLILNG